MFFEIDGNRFATEAEANKYAVAHDLVILEFFAEGGGFIDWLAVNFQGPTQATSVGLTFSGGKICGWSDLEDSIGSYRVVFGVEPESGRFARHYELSGDILVSLRQAFQENQKLSLGATEAQTEVGQSAPTDRPESDNTNRNFLADRAPHSKEQDSVREGEGIIHNRWRGCSGQPQNLGEIGVIELPTAIEIGEIISETTGVSSTTVQTIIRRLGDARLIPRSRRGKTPAAMEPVHAARILTAVLVAADHFDGTAAAVVDLVPIVEALEAPLAIDVYMNDAGAMRFAPNGGFVADYENRVDD